MISLSATARFSFASSQQATSPTGIIVPLYSYPGQGWQSLIQEKQAYPSVPVIAIINPASGPGGSQDPNYVSGIQQLESAGITVIGYVATGYGGDPVSQVEQEIYTYSQFYQLTGIFFDEMASVTGYESYYSTLTSYAESLGYNLTVGNPGTSIPASYIGTVDNLVIYENSGLPSTGYLSGLGYQTSDFSVISYGDSVLNSSFVQAAAVDVGYLYVTDQNLPNPYEALPSYLATFMATLSAVDSSTLVPITVDSVDMSGNPISGLWTTLQDGAGNIVATGFTPETFYALQGSQYQITVANYGNYTFNHWGDGSTNSTEDIVVSGPTTLVAYYGTPVTITVDAFSTSGEEIPGLITIVQSQSGDMLASGYTPFSFQATSSATYVVTICNLEINNSDYCPSVTITPTTNMELAAFYQT